MRTAAIIVIITALAAWLGLRERESDAGPQTPQPTTLLTTSGDPVGVPDSQLQFPSKAQLNLKDKPVTLTLTGTALRKKYGVKIYGMGCYLDADAKIGSAEELAAAEQTKLLHLVMERKANGADFIDAFRTAVGKERADGEFAAEFAQLTAAIKDASAEKGQSIYLIAIPGSGTRIIVHDAVDVTIPGSAFGRAIWETYLGANPLSVEMKQGLVSRLRN